MVDLIKNFCRCTGDEPDQIKDMLDARNDVQEIDKQLANPFRGGRWSGYDERWLIGTRNMLKIDFNKMLKEVSKDAIEQYGFRPFGGV